MIGGQANKGRRSSWGGPHGSPAHPLELVQVGHHILDDLAGLVAEHQQGTLGVLHLAGLGASQLFGHSPGSTQQQQTSWLPELPPVLAAAACMLWRGTAACMRSVGGPATLGWRHAHQFGRPLLQGALAGLCARLYELCLRLCLRHAAGQQPPSHPRASILVWCRQDRSFVDWRRRVLRHQAGRQPVSRQSLIVKAGFAKRDNVPQATAAPLELSWRLGGEAPLIHEMTEPAEGPSLREICRDQNHYLAVLPLAVLPSGRLFAREH